MRDIPLSSQLRPVATPVDTYVRPGPSPLRGLAESLGTVDRSLQQLLETRDRKAEQDDELRGRAAFLEDNAGSIAQAITEGKTPAQYSPFYVRGFKNAQGAAAGETLRTKWNDAWDNWEGKDSDDPEAFHKFFSEFVATNVGTKDPDVLRGVLPTVEALQANATTQYTQYRHDKTVTGNLTAHGAIISGAVQDGLDDGFLQDSGADYPTIFGSVNKVVSESLAKGDPDGKAVNTFIDVMSAKMLESRDPKLLDWFDTKVPGQDYTYGQTPHGLEVKNATLNSLESLARQQAVGLTAAEKQAMEKAKDEAQSGIINGILKDPDAPFDEKLLTQAEQNGDPLIRLHAKQWRDDLVKGTSDPRKVNVFYADVVSGRRPPKQALKEALSAGVFGSAEDMRAAVSFVQSFETNEDTIQKTLDGRVITSLLSTIKDRTSASEDLMNPISGLTNEALEASADLRQLVTRWILANPNASQPEIDEQSVKFGKQILDRMSSADIGSSARYNRDPSLPFANPYAGTDADPNGESPTQPGGSSDPEVGQWERAQNLTAEQRRTIEQQAAKAGLSYDAYVRQRALGGQGRAATPTKATPDDEEQARRRGMGVDEYLQWKQQQDDSQPKAPDGTPINKTSFNPDDPDLGEGDEAGAGLTHQQAEQFIDAAFDQANASDYTADEQTSNLKSLIRQHEAAGNYNAVYGNAHNKVDLSQFTLDDILGFQQDARRRGVKSTAIGGYQFIYKTLRGLKAEMGLSGNEKFTPELQDKMADSLLNRRGLQLYRAGRISKKQFALSLSQEWASLPNPNTGRSFYAGDGLNASSVAPSKVYASLGFTNVTPSVAPDPYANIPDVDEAGQAGQRAKFLQWNSDPVANNEANLNSINPQLSDVIRRAQRYAPVQIVVGSGKRDDALQQKAVEWGWSKTDESDHLGGNAADLWAVDDKGSVSFDPKYQQAIVKAMKRAAAELGVELDVGADWKKSKDNPHFALKGVKA
ncbi:plasmid mobilization protein [Rhizobium leguminosarum]